MPTALITAPEIAFPVDRLVTGEELLRHPEWGPCELIRGKVLRVCRPNNEHGILLGELNYHIGNFVRPRKLGILFCGDSGVYIERGPDTVRGPDLHFIRAEMAGTIDLKGYLETAPDLCVEIISPNDKWSDVEEKVKEFLGLGSKLVWIIDPRTQDAHVRRANGTRDLIPATGVLTGEDVLPGFKLPLSELFAAVKLK
jgi:Uma2 family endonuclease